MSLPPAGGLPESNEGTSFVISESRATDRGRSVLYLRTLGELSLRADDFDGPERIRTSNALAVLAVLATWEGAEASREHLAELFWPERDRSLGRRALRQSLYYLSKREVGRVLQADDRVVRLDLEHLRVDLLELGDALARKEYERVATLYGGRFLADYDPGGSRELEHWIETQDERIWTGVMVAFRELATSRLEAGHPEAAVTYARRLTALNPLNESAQIILLRVLRAAGQDARALQAYEAYRVLLRSELADEPSAALEEIVAPLRENLLSPAAPFSEDPVDPWAGWLPGSPDRSPRLGSGLRELRERLAIPLPWVAAVVLITALLVVFHMVGETAGSSSAGPAVRLLARIRSDTGGLRPVELRIRDTRAVVRPFEGDVAARPSPDGRWSARELSTPAGLDLELVELSTGAEDTVLSTPADEAPLAWSPDSRFLLYRRGRATDLGYVEALGVYDTESGESRLLTPGLGAQQVPSAHWSPLGDEIVFEARVGPSTDVYVVGFDGDSLRRLTSDSSWDGQPCWSPDGSAIAFASDRRGSRGIYLTPPQGGGARALVASGWDEESPYWYAPDRLLYLSDEGELRRLWVLDPEGGTGARPLEGTTGIDRFTPLPAVHPPRDWLERVELDPDTFRVSPGEYFRPEVHLRRADGRPLPPRRVPLSWTVEGTDSLAYRRADGWLRVRSTGRAALVASAAGWRADTARLISRPVRAGEVPVLLRESWAGGIRAERWKPFGHPEPRTDPAGAEADLPVVGGVLAARGDVNRQSGLLSQQRYPATQGITMEAWGRVPLTGEDWQDYVLAFDREDRIDRQGELRDRRLVASLKLEGQREAIRVQLSRDRALDLPLPDSTGSWHRYALQLGPDGRVSILLDGRLYWRTDAGAVGVPEGVFLEVAGQSWRTRILHGPLTVWGGPRYLLP